MGPALEKLALQ